MVLDRKEMGEVRRGVKAVYKLLGSIMVLALITLSLLPATTLAWASGLTPFGQAGAGPVTNTTVLRSQALLLKIMIERAYRSLNASAIPSDLRVKVEEITNVSIRKINTMTADQLERLVATETNVYHELTSILEKTTPPNMMITVIKTIVNQIIKNLNETLPLHEKELVHELYINITKVIETGNTVKIITIVHEVDNIAKIIHAKEFAQTIETISVQTVNTTIAAKNIEEAYKMIIKALHELNKTVDILRMIKQSLHNTNLTKEIAVSIDLALTHASQALMLLEQTVPIIKVYVETNVTTNTATVKLMLEKTVNVTLQEIKARLRNLNQTLEKLRQQAIKTNNTKLLELVNETMKLYKLMLNLTVQAEEMIRNGNLTGALRVMAEIKTMLREAWGMITKNASKYMAEDIMEKLKEIKARIMETQEKLEKVMQEAKKCGCSDAVNMTIQADEMLEEAMKLYKELEKMAASGQVNVTVALEIMNKIDSIIVQVNITITTAEGVIETVKTVKINLEKEINQTIQVIRQYNKTLAKMLETAQKLNATQAEKALEMLNKTLQQAMQMVEEANKTLQQGNVTEAAKIISMVKNMIKKIEDKMKDIEKMIQEIMEKIKKDLEQMISNMRKNINQTMIKIDRLYIKAEKLNVTDAMKLLNQSRQLLVNASRLLDEAEKMLEENKTIEALVYVGEAKLKIMEAKTLINEAEALIKAAKEKAKAKLEIEIKVLKTRISIDNKTLSVLKAKAEREKNETALKMIEQAYQLLGNATTLLNQVEEKLKHDDVTAAMQLVSQAKKLIGQAEEIIRELSKNI